MSNLRLLSFNTVVAGKAALITSCQGCGVHTYLSCMALHPDNPLPTYLIDTVSHDMQLQSLHAN